MPVEQKPAVDPVEDAIRTSVATLHDAGVDDDALEPEVPVVVEPEPAVPVTDEPAVPVVEPVAPKPGEPEAKPGEAAPAAAAKPAAKPTDDDKFAAEHGIKAKDTSGRENRIPYSAVKGRIVPNAIKAEKATWEKDVLKPVQDKVSTYETRLKGIATTEDLMFGTRDGKALPEAESLAAKKTFLSQLAASIPGYAELLKGTAATDGVAKPAADVKPSADNADDPEPKPDVLDENQKPVGWTEAGLAKLRAWDRRQATSAAVDQTVQRLTKEFGLDKIFGAFKQVESRRETIGNLNTELTAASAWPGFNDNAPAILKALEEDKSGELNPAVLLRNAYNSVIYGLASTRATDQKTLEETLRKRIAEELERAPRSTSTSTASVSTRAARDAEKTGDDVEDAIRASIRGLK